MPHSPYLQPSSSMQTPSFTLTGGEQNQLQSRPVRLGGRSYDLSRGMTPSPPSYLPPADDRHPLLEDMSIDIDALEAETGADTSDAYYFGEEDAPLQRKCTDFCVVDMGDVEEEDVPICTRAVRFMKEHPYQTAAGVVGASALLLGGGCLLYSALSASNSSNSSSDAPSDSVEQLSGALNDAVESDSVSHCKSLTNLTSAISPVSSDEPLTASVPSSTAAKAPAMAQIMGSHETTSVSLSEPPSTTADITLSTTFGNATKAQQEASTAKITTIEPQSTTTPSPSTLPEDTIVYLRNTGWYTTHFQLQCEKSGWDNQKVDVSTKYVYGGGWTAFHIPAGTENCRLSSPGGFRRSQITTKLDSVTVNGNTLVEGETWGTVMYPGWGWQKPRQYKGSEFPMFQKDTNKCISHRSIYSCRGGFPRPKQHEVTNKCLDTLHVKVKTEGKVEYNAYGFECSSDNSPENTCLDGRSGRHDWYATLRGGESAWDYGCWKYEGVETTRTEWKYTW